MTKPRVYTSIPVVVEAMQVAKPYLDVAEWCGGRTVSHGGIGSPVAAVIVPPAVLSDSRRASLWAHVGDWIVLLPDGLFTTMTDDEFQLAFKEGE